jgi:glycosyltransferase involved in cell wall biosynthesis
VEQPTLNTAKRLLFSSARVQQDKPGVDPIRVAYVLPTLSKRTGWRTHAIGLLSSLAGAINPVLYIAAEDLDEARRLFPALPVHSLPCTQSAWLTSRQGFPRLVETFFHIRNGQFPPVDLVHSFEAYPTGLVGHWLTRRLKSKNGDLPHVITCHGTYGIAAKELLLDRLLYQHVLRKARALCPVSQGTADQVVRYFGKDLVETQIVPILNGNDYFKKVTDQTALTRSFSRQPILLSVGDIKPRKGQDISLAAFSLVKRSFPEAQYWIVGDPHPGSAFNRQLESFIRQNELKGVTFFGHLSDEDLQRCYQQASIFVLTPRQVGVNFEGFGLVYLEAGAYGLPVVATRSGGVPEAVLDGRTGLLADEGDVAGVAGAILRLLEDPSLAQQLGQANRRWAQTLTWEHAAEKQLEVYRAILEVEKENENNQ